MKKVDKRNIEDILALTPLQGGLLYHHLKDPRAELYFEQLCLEISGSIDQEVFKKALNFVIEDNEMLRTRFQWQKLKKPVQLVLKEHRQEPRFYDLSGMEGSKKRKRLEDIKLKDRRERIDLGKVPFGVSLVKIGEDKHELIISNHHILYDGWSSGIILKEFFSAYHDLSAGKEPARQQKPRFREYIEWIHKQDQDRQKRFWRDYLAGFDTQTEIPLKKTGAGEISGIGNLKVKPKRDFKEDLEDFVKKNKLTLAALVYSAYGILLQKYNNSNDVIFGITVSGRSAKIKGIENMVGLFINTLPLRLETDAHKKVIDVLKEINGVLQVREEYQTTPLVNIREYSQSGNSEELFDSLVVIENYPIDIKHSRGENRFSIDSYSAFEMTHYNLTVVVSLSAELDINFIYNDEAFEQETIARLSHHFSNILKNIYESPGQRLGEIDMLSVREKKQVLFDFNSRESDYPAAKTIQRLFIEQAERTPDHIALLGKTEKADSTVSMTYRELDKASDRLAAYLVEKGAQGNDLQGIMVDRSLQMIIGILGILKTGCGYVPLNHKAPAERNRWLAAECAVKLLLVSRDLRAEARGLENPAIEIVFIDECMGESAWSPAENKGSRAGLALQHHHLPPPPSTSIAYVIFTSGSTGKPKGVPISHANFCPLMHWGYDHMKLTPGDRVVQNLSYYFDWSVWEIFIALTSGASLYMVSEQVMLNPLDYAEFIERYTITVLHITPSQFQSLTESGRTLKSLQHLAIGAEKLSLDLVRRAHALVNEECRVYNMYGPTEATIMAAVLEIERGKEGLYKQLSSIPIGPPTANCDFFILDKDLQPAPLEVPGELYIAGDAIAAGYLNNPELSAEKFVTAPAFSPQPQPATNAPNIPLFQHSSIQTAERSEARLYRTGDMARWLPDGTVEFVGRIDQQVKIRGFRIEPGEIENRLLSHETVKEAVVVTRGQGKEKYLCAYIVKKVIRQKGNKAVREEGTEALGQKGNERRGESMYSPSEASDLREFLADALPDYMVPAHFVFLEKIPLNPNGKVDRKALPEPDTSAAPARYIPPRNKIEEKLAKIWSEVLNVDYESIGIDADFFKIGGHSLRATTLIAKIHKEFNVSLKLTEIFKMTTIKKLAAHIQGSAVEDRFLSIEPVEKKDYYPLSPAQKRFFIFQQFEPDSISYNLYETMEFTGRVEQEKIAAVFKRLIRRHESLRTSFQLVDGEPVQRVHKTLDTAFEIEHFDIDGLGEREPGADFDRAFDLSCAPLLRVGLVKFTEEKYHLMIDMHHIICDGTSVGVFIGDFLSIYNGEDLPPLKIQYRDYIRWLHDRQKRGRAREYLPRDFQSELLELPTDYLRPAVQSFAGSTENFDIGKEEAALLYKFSSKKGSTLYMLLFAVFNIFLSKLSGQERIVVGSPIAGRQHDDLEGIIGLFINTLVIKSRPAADKNFDQFLEEVKENSLQAYENQEFQYDDLVQRIEMSRDSSRNPLFDVMFVLQNMEIPEFEIAGLKIKRGIQENKAAKFDMTLYCEEEKGALYFTLEYCTRLFKQGTIQRFIKYFKKILFAVLEDPKKRIGQIEFISPEEKREILYGFNDTAVEYARDTTIYRLFEEQAARTAGSIAVAQSEAGDLTYRQLNEMANRLARVLRTRGVKANSVVGIMSTRSAELIAAIYAVLKAGGAYLPLDPEYPEKRILSMLTQSKAQMLLTKREIIEQKNLAEIPQQTVTIDELAGLISSQLGANLEPLSRADDLIYIIFTSGSTGIPKGAGVYHRSFVNLVNWFVKDFGLTADDSNLLMTSFSFDLTQKNFYASLLLGGILCIPPLNYFDPGEILRELEEKRITWINCTPSMFFQLIEYCQGDELKRMESLRYVYLGGEPISMSMFMKWLESGYCHGEIVNTYGPTECTDISNSYRIKEPCRFLAEAVPIGKPVYNVKLYVCDKNLQLLPVGIAGELLIAGESVGIGYVNDRELTEKKFIPHSFVKGESEQLLYRTGDLVRWLPDGNIVFIGRMDYQVKVRGFRIEIGEIESQLLNHEDIKEAVVLAIDSKRGASPGQGDKFLCAYIVTEDDKEVDIAALKERLSDHLPDYMIPAHFVEMKELPLNPNGKVNRKALPLPDIVSEQEYTAPRNGLEEKLAEIWCRILGIEKEKIGIDNNFFALGGHSLKAAELIAAIHRELNAEIALKELFRIATIRGLSESISKGQRSRYVAIEPVEKKEYYALSSAQKRLYLLRQMDLESTSYNIPSIFMVAGALDREKLQETFWELIQRHESLRTSFHMIKDEPVQKIHKPDDIEFGFEYYSMEARGESMSSPESDFIRSFDLSQAPLLRVGLLRQEKEKHLLMLDMHHIISDGISSHLFVCDFLSLYNRERLQALKIQYKDFSGWQNQRKESEALTRQEAYWLKEFAAEIPVLNLPTDFPRPTIQGFAGSSRVFEIGTEELEKLKALALEKNTTLFMMLLSLFNVFLARICGQEDIVVGSPVSGRTHGDLEQVIGIFINTLALRNYPGGEKGFDEFLLELADRTLAAFDNQEYQFEDLVERVEVARDVGRNPLFDVLFVLQNMETSGIEIPGLKLMPYEYEGKTAKFDLTFNAIEGAGELYITVSYRTDLFLERTVLRFIDYFKTILGSVLKEPGQKLHEIEMLSEQERTRLLIDFNDTGANYSRGKTIHRLFEEQVEREPDAIALIAQGSGRSGISRALSYRELDREANRLARLLRDRGVVPDTISGILTESSPEMIIGILAVIKSGGAYLPLDPRHPAERIAYMLEDSRAKLLLAQEHLAERVRFNAGLINIADRALYKGDGRSLEMGSGPGSVIYAIYTSGTTGKSKGALITHANLVNYVEWFVKKANLSSGDRSALTSSFAFDLGYTAIFSSLLAGCQLHVVREEIYLSPGDLIDYIEKNRLTYVKMTPSLFSTIVDSPLFSELKRCSLRLVVLGGEEIKLKDVKKAHETLDQLEVMNHYGPTEATIGCIAQFIDFHRFEQYISKPTIGHPIHNTRVFILDRNLSLLPGGVVGELYLSGEGLVRGYLNRVELTTKCFVENPYLAGDRLYRTGDLACRLADGTIEFVGRSDNQVKIRGFRIETGEIESQLSRHGDVKETAVLLRENEQGDRYLCAYVVAADGAGAAGKSSLSSQLKKYLSQLLPGYMVPSYFVELDRMPLTANGKVDRRRLPVPETEVTGGEFAGPGDRVETEVAHLWSEVLGIEKIGIDDNFFLLGGHSLKAIMIGSRIQKVFGVKIALAEIFNTPTIRAIAAHIKNRQGYIYYPTTSIEPAEGKEYYALSSAQKRLYFLQQMDEGGIGYNTPRTHLLAGKIDRERLGNTFKKLIERHESLRTSFHEVDDEPRQKIDRPDDIEFKIEEFTGVLADPHTFFRPFDLAKAPLIRVGLMPIHDFDTSSQDGNSKEEHMLMVDMHHIITDGISTGIFIREFMAIYSGDELAPLRIQYKDYSEWQNRNKQSESIMRQEEYWLDQFKGELPVLNLPTDYHGSAETSFAGDSISFEIGKQDTGALNGLANEEGATLFMVLLALYNVLLSKLGCCEDVVVGMPIMGRKQPELQHTIGMFVNTLVLRNYPTGEKTFKKFLEEIKERTLAALENQDYQFEDLVEKVESTLDRKSHRNPLFDVMFVLQNLDIPGVEIPGLTLTPYEYKSKTAKFDLTLVAEERGEGLHFTFEYSSELFRKETIERFSGYYQDLAALVLSNRDIKIYDIDISTGLSDSEQVKYSEASGEFGF